MIRNGVGSARTQSISPKRILTSLKSEIMSPGSVYKTKETSRSSHLKKASFSHRVSPIKKRVLVNLYGYHDLKAKGIFPLEKRETIRIPKVKPDLDLSENSKSPQRLGGDLKTPHSPVVLSVTPKPEPRPRPCFNYINFSDFMNASVKTIVPIKGCFSPKKIVSQGRIQSHLNRGERKQKTKWMLMGRSALPPQEAISAPVDSDRLNQTLPLMQLSELDESVRFITKSMEHSHASSVLHDDFSLFRIGKNREKQLSVASYSRCRTNSSSAKAKNPAESEGRQSREGENSMAQRMKVELRISTAEPGLKKRRPATASHTHDRTTSMSFDFNENWRASRVLMMTKVDIGKDLQIGRKEQYRRPASAKSTGKKTFFQ